MKWLFLGMMAGIPVVMGTHAGNIGTLHGPSVFHEMAMMLRSVVLEFRTRSK